MNLLDPAAGPAEAVPTSVAIGVFDGVHVGHQAVIRRTLEEAQVRRGMAVAVTFDRHPSAILAPKRTPPLIYPLWRKLEALSTCGLDATLTFAFDEEFSQQSGVAFVDRLRARFPGLASVCVGSSFVFGHGRSGDLGLLERMGVEHRFAVYGLPAVQVDGEAVSSTRIRDLVSAGRLDEAAPLLGRRHTLAGVVVEGEKLGRQMGYPTANVDVAGLVLPPNGVYAGFVTMDGKCHAIAVNIGRRPTVAGKAAPIRVEAHLLGFRGDLYGRRLELELHLRLRDEKRFRSRDMLMAQICQDLGDVRRWAGE